MRRPNLNEEKRLWKKGYKIVIGLDEAGRGPLAGPVVAGAVSILDTKYQILNIKIRIRDSKQLSFSQREKLYRAIVKDSRLRWGIGRVSERVVDKINILEATKLAMAKAVKNLTKKLKKHQARKPTTPYQSSFHSDDTGQDLNNNKALEYQSARPVVKSKICTTGVVGNRDCLILDGNFKINVDIPQKSIIKGDEKVFSCAAASILAKVTRDRIMLNYHKKYPKYRFDLHKGYPTKLHLKMLKKYGLSKIHRKTFKPVLSIAKK